jgi:phosphoribosyl 1,2-cyclic phosphodiesterase
VTSVFSGSKILFPVDINVMGAVRHFYDVGEHAINLNGATISSAPLNHPQGCVGYRIEADGGVLVLATDTEPGSPEHDRALRELAKGADVLVYDAQYTPEQLRGEKKGWGHSSWYEGTRIARESRVKQLMLFHYDPDHDDAFVDGLVEKARREFPNVFGAAEGMAIEMTLPDEITHRGDLHCRFIAQPVRHEPVKGPLRSNRLSLGVAAHLAVAEKSSSPARSSPSKR